MELTIVQTLLIKEGEKQNNLLLIVDGQITVKRNNDTLNKLGRGKFVAEMSLITNEPATADIYSNENTRYISWDQNELKHFKCLIKTYGLNYIIF